MSELWVKIKAQDLKRLARELYEAYAFEGERQYLDIPLEMGLIEEKELTQEDIDNKIYEDVSGSEIGDTYYYFVTEDEIYKKFKEKENET